MKKFGVAKLHKVTALFYAASDAVKKEIRSCNKTLMSNAYAGVTAKIVNFLNWSHTVSLMSAYVGTVVEAWPSNSLRQMSSVII